MGRMEKVERRERTEWTNNMNLTQLMTGMPIGEWKNTSQIKINQYNNDGKAVQDGENIIHEILKYSGSVVCGLIQGGLAPMRSVKIRDKTFVEKNISNFTDFFFLHFSPLIFVFFRQFVFMLLFNHCRHKLNFLIRLEAFDAIIILSFPLFLS